MAKVLTHPTPHQRTRGGHGVLIVLSFPSHLSQRWSNIKSYQACCDSGVLGRFRQPLVHLHNVCAYVVYRN